MRRSLALFAVLATLVGAACVPLATPADTTHIEPIGHDDGRRMALRRLPRPRLPVLDQRLPDVRDRDEGRIVDGGGTPVVRVHARRRRRVLRRGRQPGAGAGPEGRGVGDVAHEPPDEQRPARSGPQRRSRVPHAGGLLLQPRPLRRLGDARSPQPERHAGGRAAPDDRAPVGEGRGAVRNGAVPDDEDLPLRRQRRLGRDVRRGVGHAAAGHRPGGRDRRREPRERRGVRRRERRRHLRRQELRDAGARRSPAVSTRTSRTSPTSRTSSSPPAGSPCRSCTSGTTPT